MKKEGFRGPFNSQSGKVNLALLFSIVLVFILSMIYAEAITIQLFSPGNLTFNGSRNVNFTWAVSWSAANENMSNCTIWVNSTTNNIAWSRQKVIDIAVNGSISQPDDRIMNASGSGNNLSYANLTFTGDGNFTWSIACYSNNISGTLTFPTTESGGTNRTVYVDTLAPTITLDTVLGGILADTTGYNITSYETATFYVNVSDNSTHTVWIILNNNATVTQSVGSGYSGGTNESVNRSMIAGTVISTPNGRRQFYFNLSPVLNFNSSFTSPGPHSIIFCANDTFNRVTCTNRSDFIIKGGNITQMENIFSAMQQKTGGGDFTGPSFGGLNITTGNGTEIPEGTFLNPIDGVTFAGFTYKNFTFIINISKNILVHIVGIRIDENQFTNASNTKVNNTPSREIQTQLGTGYSATMAWADIASFLPSEVSYEYGILQLGGVGYSKKMYCNGTSVLAPNCHLINQCNATVFGIYNATPGQTTSSTGVIPTNDACWLETTVATSPIINGQNFTTTYGAGYTLIFVDHFSGGLGGSDFSQINVTFNGNLTNNLNTTTAFNFINFTLEDINSTGLNLTMNNSINITLTLGGSVVAQFNYLNVSTSNITCVTADTASPQNTTSVTCNATYATFSNGTYIIAVTARDTSNNSNPANVTSNITVTIDQIPPVFIYYNFTNASKFNTTGIGGFIDSIGLGLGSGVSRAQGDPNTGIIYAVANWTDNLTNVQLGLLQFYNSTSSSWKTANITVVNGSNGGFRNGGWTNFSFPIPKGHNEFEGGNISFRIIANDTLGNINNSAQVKNFTIQINDTTVPTITINGTISVNGTNTTNTRPIIGWAVDENSKLTSINVSVDATLPSTGGGVDGCGKSAFYSSSLIGAFNVEKHRNDSFQIQSADADPSCPLGNGTHYINITSVDIWLNTEKVGYTFSIQSGSNPELTLATLQNGLSAINQSNVTPFIGINFTVTIGATGTLKNMSFTSSCNSTVQTFTNTSFIWPFNSSGCKNTEANQTVTVTVVDTAGNSITNTTQFAVDNLGPTISVDSPTQGQSFSGIVYVNVSALDGMNRVDTIGYYLDGSSMLLNHTINGSTLTAGQGTNTSLVNRSINFTPGTHTIKIRVNDTLGNERNSSVITFTQVGALPAANTFNTSLITYLSIANSVPFNATSALRLKSSDGSYTVLGSNITDSSGTFEIFLVTNSSSANNQINVTLTDINGSGANWDKINFSMLINETKVKTNVQSNWTNTILQLVSFNSSINEFLPNQNGYYGTVLLPGNISATGGLFQEIWWFANESNLQSKTNISSCSDAGIGGYNPTLTTPCWNYTSGGKTIVLVPHFSIVVAVNDSGAPVITVNVPPSVNQTESMFVPNITVTSDTVSCQYQTNKTSPSLSDNISMSIVTQGADKLCIGQTERSKNLQPAGVGFSYNISFFATDSNGNVRTGVLNFNVSDNTAPNTPNSSTISTSVSTTSATVTISGINETVNATIFYGTAIGTLSSIAMETDFNTSQAVSLSSLTANTLYYFNLSICDFNGNCAINGTFNLTTNAAAAAAAASTSSSSGGGGSAAGAVITEPIAVASASRQWDSLSPGTSGVLNINKDDIAITGVTIDVQNTVDNPSLTVGSLSSNPESASAAAKVYQYLQITKSNIADSDVSKVTISFKVPKSWLTSKGVTASNIVLWRYNSDKWEQLPTTQTGEDASNYIYQATTPGFSYFAVGTKEAGTSAFVIIDMIRDFYAGTSKSTAFDIIDQIRAFYGG